jgi:hypothetical protein
MSSGLISADFLFNIEKQLRVLNERGYMKMLASENAWARKVLKTRPLEGKSERLLWLLSTASIEQLTAFDGGESGGSINFDELATITTEYFPAQFARGYKIGKLKYRNALQGGIDPVARWVEDIGMYGAYVPQRLTAQTILNGANLTGYDGVSFWNKLHPVHPLITALGTYANTFTGSSSPASGLTPAYPGALPIDDTQDIDVALQNLAKALAYITGAVKQPNGAGDPRWLVPAFLLHPPRMQARVEQLLDAAFIPQVTSGGGAGSADVKAYLRKYRLMEPVLAKELDGSTSYTIPNPATGGTTTLTGSDTTYYIVCKEASETELGAFIENLRMPFYMTTYTGDAGTEGVDAVLGRSNDLEWHYEGWTGVQPGHPFTIFQFQGS